ncbi:hypothetical protein [Halosimplex salinum]|uniref:hypothetical protein n=1 Tax=Halosimplex salinum TaxID=1710538 RepID=UPI000F46E6A5|nr:hypothetical protein [Halosimplex salinum]
MESQPDPNKPVQLVNSWDEIVEIDVRVIREATNETVYKGSHTVGPGTDPTVYNLVKADPDGIEAFTTVVTVRNETRRVTIETNECYAGVRAGVSDSGKAFASYDIC